MSFVRKTQVGPKPQAKRSTNIPYSKPNTSKKENSPIPEPAKSNVLEDTTPIANINTLSQDNANKDRHPDDSPHDRNILPYRPGMEDGYDKSPMAKLWAEYQRDGDLSGMNESRLSTESRVKMLSTKLTLVKEEVIDTSSFNSDVLSRYQLESNLLEVLLQTVNELQIFIQQEAKLIPERQTYFIVDPNEVATRTLAGSQTIAQLQAAWSVIAKRLETGSLFLVKYDKEYREGISPRSPASTDRALHAELHNTAEKLPVPAAMDRKLRYMYSEFPRHNNSLSALGLIKLGKGEPWQEIIPTYPWMRAGDATGYVVGPESNSYLSEVEEVPSQGTRGRVEQEYSTRSTNRDQNSLNESEDHYSTDHKGISFETARTEFVKPISPLLGTGTPFKSSHNFFKESENEEKLRPFPLTTKKPESNQLPNVLHGLGAPSLPSNSNPIFSAFATQITPDVESGFTYDNPINVNSQVVELPASKIKKRRRRGRSNDELVPNQSSERDIPPHLPRYSSIQQTSNVRFENPKGGVNETSRLEKTFKTLTDPAETSKQPNPSRKSTRKESRTNNASDPSSSSHSTATRESNNRRPPNGPRRSFGGGGPPDGNPPNGPSSGNPGPFGGNGPPGGDPPDPYYSGEVDNSSSSDPRLIAPYGDYIPTIKAELKLDQLPKWDGNHDTAIDYFWKVQQIAALGGYIPKALGYWLWHNLEEGSAVQIWFAMLEPNQQAYMRSHYLAYLKGIKDGFLGRTWQMRMNNQYENQSFRQRGHENETPAKFISRRIMYTRMLVANEHGGPLEVYLVMRRAPIAWGSVINIDSIRNTSQLYARVTEHEKALIYSTKVESSQALTTDNLIYSLRKLGINIPQSTQSSNSKFRRRVNFGEKETDVENESKQEENPLAIDDPIPLIPDSLLKEVYQVLKRTQRPPPKGGYPFPKNDHITTKMGRAPPSPCKVCGSENHWDKECSDWDAYLETRKRTANVTFWTQDEDNELEQHYTSAYSILMNNRLAQQLKVEDDNPLPQGFTGLQG